MCMCVWERGGAGGEGRRKPATPSGASSPGEETHRGPRRPRPGGRAAHLGLDDLDDALRLLQVLVQHVLRLVRQLHLLVAKLQQLALVLCYPLLQVLGVRRLRAGRGGAGGRWRGLGLEEGEEGGRGGCDWWWWAGRWGGGGEPPGDEV
jgi:hypothetical protein